MLAVLIAVVTTIASADQSETNRPSFAIYLTKLSTNQIQNLERNPIPLASIPLENEPLISERDLIEYDFSKHIMKLTLEGFQKVEKIKAPSVSHGVPFVVVAGGVRRYTGVFWSVLSSAVTSFPNIPVPVTVYGNTYGTNCVPILAPSRDVRATIYMPLHKLGVLKKEH